MVLALGEDVEHLLQQRDVRRRIEAVLALALGLPLSLGLLLGHLVWVLARSLARCKRDTPPPPPLHQHNMFEGLLEGEGEEQGRCAPGPG